MRPYEGEVRRGIAWLDGHFEPGYDWRARVDLETLDMESVRLCVGGQLGIFQKLPDPLDVYGFNADDAADDVDYPDPAPFVSLTEEWRRQLGGPA